MIGLDSYSRQVFNYLDYILIYINRLPIWNFQNCSTFPLAFVAVSLQGHWRGFISRNYVVWPTFFLVNVFIALKTCLILFVVIFNYEKTCHVTCKIHVLEKCLNNNNNAFHFFPLKNAPKKPKMPVTDSCWRLKTSIT